ncbi:MAG TPA: hypothetical protein VHM48_06350 [Candidatus Limnocylindrales bacterium]|nr:hypothetical protein [Candidatus Limnocylindrales bacterium]
MSIEHRATRTVDQRPEVVHDRLLELAARVRDETPPVEPGTQISTLLGMSGDLGIEVADRGPRRIELRTTQGRIRGEGVAELAATADGRTTITLDGAVKAQGFAANLMLGVALKAMPSLEKDIVDGLEKGLDELAVELAKSDADWNAADWRPSQLPARA